MAAKSGGGRAASRWFFRGSWKVSTLAARDRVDAILGKLDPDAAVADEAARFVEDGLPAHAKVLSNAIGASARKDKIQKGLAIGDERSEEHTSELQSPCNLVCRLLLEKKKKNKIVSSIVDLTVYKVVSTVLSRLTSLTNSY